MSDLIVNSKSAPDANGSVVKVTPESAGWGYVGFEVLRLPFGEAVERRADGEEVCLVPLSGTCSVVSKSEAWEIGGRKGPFDGPPHALYLRPERTTGSRPRVSWSLRSAPPRPRAAWRRSSSGRRRSSSRRAARGTWSARCGPYSWRRGPPNACSSSRC